ncbi:MAG: hypothetical protein KDB07_13605, partial [Planctomycetes bacterium]|nr:hypothetical protein [Planctomycetota bacterium]
SEAPRRVSGPAQNEPKTPKDIQPEVDENELFAPRETEPSFARLELPDFWGSKFQARLTLGEFAAQLAAWTNDQAFTPEQIEDALARSFGYALSVDNMGAFREAARAGDKDALIDAILEELTKVRREGLTLQTPRGAKPILEADGKAWGRDALVRIWSKSKGLDSFVVNDAERMVRDILRLCQASAGEGNMGYDLLYGEQLGGEFFPDSAFIDVEARGVYVLQDKLSMVAHQRSVIQVDTVVKHELVHAVLYGLSDDFESSRFISEGLAEYLRLLPQIEPEKGVSERALAHEAAALLSMLSIMKAKGADLSQLSFDRMLALKPSGFYGLGTFGYLAAQLAMAYSGWETVSTCLRANNDRAIANFLRTRGWDEFEAFLKRVSKGGNPRKARSVSDRVIGPPYLKDSEFVLALNQAGIIPTKGTSRALLELSRDSILSGRSAASALLGNASATMLYLSDTSKALEASFVFAQVPPNETFPIPNTSLAVNTRQLFVENLHYELQNQRNAVIPFVALHENLFDLPR